MKDEKEIQEDSGFRPPQMSKGFSDSTFLQRKFEDVQFKITTSQYPNGFFNQKAQSMVGKIDYWKQKNNEFIDKSNKKLQNIDKKDNFFDNRTINFQQKDINAVDMNKKVKQILGFR